MNSQKKTVFISYARENKARIKTLVSALESDGLEVWWDVETPPGERFADVIYRALQSADWVIVAWSKASTQSEWVRREALVGLERKVLLPILLDDQHELPFLFKDIHACNFIGWDGDKSNQEYLSLSKALQQDSLSESIFNKSASPMHPEPIKPKVIAQNKPPSPPHPKPPSNKYIKLVLVLAISVASIFAFKGQVSDSKTETTKSATSTASQPKPVDEAFSDFIPKRVAAKPSLLLRNQPSLSSTKMDAVDFGDMVLIGPRVSAKVVIDNKEGYWVKVKGKGRSTLYAFDAYVEDYPVYMVTATSGLIIREKPDRSATKVLKLKFGEKVHSLFIGNRVERIGSVSGRWHKAH